MSRSRKIFLGILSFLPLVLFAIYMTFFITMFFDAFRFQEVDPEFMFGNFYLVAAAGILMAFTSIGLLIYFLVHVVNNKQLDSTERIVWILIILFAGMIGFPLYWYMRIWKQPDLIPTV